MAGFRNGEIAPRKKRIAGAALLAVLAVSVLTACGSGSHARSSRPVVLGTGAPSSGVYDGDHLSTPIALSPADQSAVFRTSAGTSTTLGALQHGKLMLLYFGYTSCPDVCPTTMSDLGRALKQVPVQSRFHTQVVFVTSDPARDTPAVLKTWLGNFDVGLPVPFVGLTAPIARIDSIGRSLGVALAPPVTNPDGSITVQHGAQTLAFLDGKADLLWSADTSASDYAHDIVTLLDRNPP
jgi:protein SCO1/2